MAVLVISDNPGVSAEQHKAINQRLGVATNPPMGALAQLEGPIEGGWRIISLWESREAWDAFLRDRLGPTLSQIGVTTLPKFEVWPVQTMMIAPQLTGQVR